eukprot:gene4462-7844_t
MDTQHSSLNILLSITMLLGGCLSNNITLELMLYVDSGCGSLLTICQFLLITIQGIFQQFDSTKFWLKDRKIPIKFHLIQVVLFFGSTIASNIAYSYHISLPLMNLFRSGALAMNLIVGMIIFRLKQPLSKIFAVLMVTFGIAITSWETSQTGGKVFNEELQFEVFIIGIGLIIFSLCLQATLGNVQQYVLKTFEADYRENVFYSHLFSLPFFFLMTDDLLKHIEIFSGTEKYNNYVSIPYAWVLMLFNVLTQ